MKNFLRCIILLTIITSHCLTESSQKYVIGTWPAGGMGVCMISALQHLAYCEQEKKVPVVYWGPDSLYYHPNGFNGEMNNAWEYYFEPVSSLKYSNNDEIHHCCGSSNSCGKFHSQNLDQQELRDQAHNLWQKYIKPKTNIQTKTEQFYRSQMQNKHIIGIHLRGTDITPYLKHLNLKAIADTALKHATKDSQFFIMSDDLKLFDKLCALLKDHKIISYSCYRSEDGKPLHYKNKKRPSFAQTGEDVIVEMLLLAQCDYLVLMESNISAIPLVINNEVNFTFFWHDAVLRI